MKSATINLGLFGCLAIPPVSLAAWVAGTSTEFLAFYCSLALLWTAFGVASVFAVRRWRR